MPLNQNPEAGRKLQRQYGFNQIQDLNVADEIVPVAIVDNLPATFPSELVRPAIAFAARIPLAGQFARLIVSATVQDVLLERMTLAIEGVGSTPVLLEVGNLTLSGFQPEQSKGWKNRRIPGQPGTFIGSKSDTSALDGTIVARYLLPTDRVQFVFEFPEPFRLAGRPGPQGDPFRALSVVPLSADTNLEATFEFTEFDIQR